MTDTTETLDTLIAYLEDVKYLTPSGVIAEAAKALTDLRTERDAALAERDEAWEDQSQSWSIYTSIASALAADAIKTAHGWCPECSGSGMVMEFEPTDCPNFETHRDLAAASGYITNGLHRNATVSTTALADRDARILEEAADDIDAYMTLPEGMNTIEQRYFRPWHAEWLRARGASVRAGADNPASHDSQSGAEHA